MQMRCVGIEVARSASSGGPPMVAEVNVRNFCMVVVAANRLPDKSRSVDQYNQDSEHSSDKKH